MAKQENIDSKNVKIANALLQARVDLLASIEKAEKRIAQINSKNVTDMEELNKLTTEARELEEKILKEKEEIEKIDKRTQKRDKDKIDLLEERVELEQKLERLANDQSKASFLQEKALKNLTGASKEWSLNQDISLQIMQNQAYTTLETNKLLAEQGSLSENFLKTMEMSNGLSADLQGIQDDITKSVAEASQGQYKSVDLSKIETALGERRAEIEFERKQILMGNSDISQKELDILQGQLEADEEHLQNLNDQNKALTLASEKANKVLGVYDNLLSMDFKGAIKSGLNFDGVKKDLREKVGMSFVTSQKKFAEVEVSLVA